MKRIPAPKKTGNPAVERITVIKTSSDAKFKERTNVIKNDDFNNFLNEINSKLLEIITETLPDELLDMPYKEFLTEVLGGKIDNTSAFKGNNTLYDFELVRSQIIDGTATPNTAACYKQIKEALKNK
uniref:Structural protein n=1 Tax=Rhabditophanes sp. KR3021 TaxID=114890 RepID=A0AC35UCM4_9BILA